MKVTRTEVEAYKIGDNVFVVNQKGEMRNIETGETSTTEELFAFLKHKALLSVRAKLQSEYDRDVTAMENELQNKKIQRKKTMNEQWETAKMNVESMYTRYTRPL